MFISGTSGHACYNQQHTRPYMKDGRLLRLNFTKNIYELTLQQSTGGTIAGSPVSGESGTTFNLSATPSNKYTFEGWSVTGTSLTGSAGTYTNSDVTAKGNWTYHAEWTPKSYLPFSAIIIKATLPASANTLPSANPPTTKYIGTMDSLIAQANQKVYLMPTLAAGSDIYSAYSASAGYNLALYKTPAVIGASQLSPTKIGSFGFGVAIEIPKSSTNGAHWKAFYGKGNDMTMTNSGFIPYTAITAGGTFPRTSEYNYDWGQFFIMPFSADSMIIERDKYFCFSADTKFNFTNTLGYQDTRALTGLYVSAGYGRME